MTIPLPLHQWATHYRIPPEALVDLLALMGAEANPAPAQPNGAPGSEGYVQSLVRFEAPRYGVWLTRNNVGALQDKTGRPVRYGLANESKQQNETMKSGDLIGIRAVLVQPWHVGTTIGQFVSRECKHAAWHYSGDEHEAAQLNWINLVTRYGGDACFVRGQGSFAP